MSSERPDSPENQETSLRKVTKLQPTAMCGGVVAAVNFTELLLSKVAGREPVYAFNPIVHNHNINRRHQSLGLVVISERTEDGDWPHHLVPNNSLFLPPAHGHTERDIEILEAKGCLIFPTVCTLVVNEWDEVEEAVGKGKMVLLFAKSGHPEPRGTLSRAPKDSIRIIEKAEDIDQYVRSSNYDPSREHVMANQTTQSIKDIREARQRAIDLIPIIDVNDKRGGCYATDNRQKAAEIALTQEGADALLVVGSGDISNNTRNLAKVAWDLGKPGLIVNDAREIDWGQFRSGSGIEHLAITGSASCEDEDLDGVVDAVSSRGVELYYQDPVVKEKRTEFPIPGTKIMPLLELRYRNWPVPQK